jgi:hypothetical protein
MDSKFESLYSLICSVASLSNDLFVSGFPHKGALAYGRMTLDFNNSIFFGQPLIDAFLLQEEINYYGIIFHSSAEKEIITNKRLSELIFINRFNCPLKNGNAWHYTIQPISAGFININNKELQDECKQLFESVKQFRFKTSGYLRKYIDNTLSYLTQINENKLTKDE